MRKNILIFLCLSLAVISCNTTKSSIPKSEMYSGIYNEEPLVVLIMPPINNSNNVEAKEYFHSTLNIPIANAGYYVIPPFLSIEILKQESAYDSELFIEQPLNKFNDVFGADVAVFTIIHKWEKSGLASNVYVEVEYIIKSTKTDQPLYHRNINATYDASVSLGMGGLVGALADITASAINTAATKYVDVARATNAFTFGDLPSGKYSPNHGTDGVEMADKKTITTQVTKTKKKY